MAPADGNPPSTWIGVNEAGFGGCILNRYQDPVLMPGTVSRGALLPAMLEETTPAEVETWLRRIVAPAVFSPFTLIVFDPQKTCRFDWDGIQIEGPLEVGHDACTLQQGDHVWTLLTSSSWRQRTVVDWRQRRFREWWEAGATFRGHIPSIHLLSPPTLEAWAPLMSRRLTATRSLTQIRVDTAGATVELRYWPLPHPRSRGPSHQLSLPLDRTLLKP